MVCEVEALTRPKFVLWRILQNTKKTLKDKHHKVIVKMLDLLARLLNRIVIFLTEHRLFDFEFIFENKKYVNHLEQWGNVLGGFLISKGLPNPSLKSTGLLTYQHDDNDKQEKAYMTWFKDSI